MRVFFSAGEASGDAYAAELLRRLQPERLDTYQARLARVRHDERIASNEELSSFLVAESAGLKPHDQQVLIAAVSVEQGLRIPDEIRDGPEPIRNGLKFVSDYLAGRSAETHVAFEAIGGKKLSAAGARLIADSSHWGALGIIEALKVAPRVIASHYRAKIEMKLGRPGVFIPIDFGYMNVRLARHAKNNGWKVLYFIPPGSWRKNKQGVDLPRVTDAIVTPFPWSRDLLNAMGAKAFYYGHPLKEMVAAVPDVPKREGIAVLPGSRRHEIESNVPVIAEAIKTFEGPVRIALAPTADEEQVRRAWKKWSDLEATYVHSAAAALKASRSAVVCSGTATLEAALCACPCVVVYRGNWVMELEYRIRRPKFEFISLPNILLERPLLKELIQWDATSQAVRTELEDLDREGARRAEVLAGFAEITASLGDVHCLERTVELVREMLTGDQVPGRELPAPGAGL